MKAWLPMVFLIVSAASPARADVYACKDKEGVVRFADRKLKGMRCVLYAKTPPAPAPTEASGGDTDVADGGGTQDTPRPSMSRAEQRR
ncbi:MAG TPA: DUF4124 domain-containing protein, partial [Myxococcota bacterium]|nr:DUF4124 domain-containing protein [Myxococcota bacterium]